MSTDSRPGRAAACLLTLLLAAGAARADDPPTDGRWRGTLGAGVSLSSGNTESSTLSFNGEATNVTPTDRINLNAKALSARTNGVQSGEQWKLGGRYETKLGERSFGTVGIDAEHDRIAELSRRVSPNIGVGYRVYDFDDLKFNVSTGLAYVDERYTAPRLVDGVERTGDSYATVIFSEDSSHKINATVSARQRLVLTPRPGNGGNYRADFDSGLAVTLTEKLALNVGLTVRYDNNPAPGLRRTDSLLITGLALKID